MFTARGGGETKAISITLEDKKHTFEFRMSAHMYVVVFRDSDTPEVIEITDAEEAANIAKWKFTGDMFTHTLFRESTEGRKRHRAVPPSRLRMIAV